MPEQDWDWELLAGPDTITEGPAWDGHGLLYTSIAHNEIRRYDPATNAISVVYRDTHATNGLFLADDGTLYACEGESGAIARYDIRGHKSILASQFEDKRLNSPNDLVLDRQGWVWFTDPRYGIQEGRELDHDSVYRLTPTADGSTPWPIERMTFDTTRPNGLLFSPDERTLYVAQSDYSGKKELRAYPVQDDGTLGQYTVLHDFGDARGIDGMCLETGGNIVATCGWDQSGPGPRVAVFAPDGRILEEEDVPAGAPTNCIFGGHDLTHLYVTTLDGRLYRVRNTGLRGALQPPSVRPYVG